MEKELLKSIRELIKEAKEANYLLNKINNLLLEQNNFWHALKEEEFGEGANSLNTQYLKELAEDGFHIPEG